MHPWNTVYNISFFSHVQARNNKPLPVWATDQVVQSWFNEILNISIYYSHFGELRRRLMGG